MGRFEGRIGELHGRLMALEAQVTRLETRTIGGSPDKYGGVKTMITFASLVIVPIVVALLGGYFALRSAGLR
jgi:hypothetical protein